MKKIILNIEGMTCSACSNGLEKYLKKQDGIKDASVNLVMATAMIEYDEKLSIKDLANFVEEAGFKSLGQKQEENKNNNELFRIIVFAILSIILMYVSMAHMFKLPTLKLLDMRSLSKNIYCIFTNRIYFIFIFGI